MSRPARHPLKKRPLKKRPAARRPPTPFDWNTADGLSRPRQPFDLFDETLRDGVQSPSVVDPPLSAKRDLLEQMAGLGIAAVDLGQPWASTRALNETVALARHLSLRKLPLEAACASRTTLEDLAALAEVAQRSGRALTAYCFVGSSPIRQWVEGWDLKLLLRRTEEALRFARAEGLQVAFTTEDTTRSAPQHLEALFTCAVEAGAERLVLCDTVGHATPDGTRALVRFTQACLRRMGAKGVKIDWHGHNDRGMAEANALFALEAGAHRLHGCANGIGERVGNAAIEVLCLNLQLLGWAHVDLKRLVDYATSAAQATGFQIPPNAPLVGRDAFRTATGVHAAAIAKAKARGSRWLADRIYSAIPATESGREQEVGVGPLSGMSNVRYWLSLRGLPAPESLCQALLARAKAAQAPLTDEALWRVVDAHLSRKGRSKRAG